MPSETSEDEVFISLLAHSSDPSLSSTRTPSPFNSDITTALEYQYCLENSLNEDETSNHDLFNYTEFDDSLGNADLALSLGLPVMSVKSTQPNKFAGDQCSIDDDGHTSLSDPIPTNSIFLPPGISLHKLPMKENSMDSQPDVASNCNTSPCQRIAQNVHQRPDVLEISKVSVDQGTTMKIMQPASKEMQSHVAFIQEFWSENKMALTKNMVDEASKLRTGNIEIDSIHIKIVPELISAPSSPIQEGNMRPDVAHSGRTVPFEKLQQALWNQVPTNASRRRRTVARDDTVHSLSFNCSLQATSNTQQFHFQAIPSTQFHNATMVSNNQNHLDDLAEHTDQLVSASKRPLSEYLSSYFPSGWYSDTENAEAMQEMLFLEDLNEMNERIENNDKRESSTTLQINGNAGSVDTHAETEVVANRAETLEDIINFLDECNDVSLLNMPLDFGTWSVFDQFTIDPVYDPPATVESALNETEAESDHLVIDVESVDERTNTSNSQLFPVSNAILKRQSNSSNLSPLILPITSRYTTVGTSPANGQSDVELNPYHRFFRSESQSQTRVRSNGLVARKYRKLSSYARSLMKRQKSDLKSRNHGAGHSSLSERSMHMRNPKQRANHMDEVDILVRIQATECSLESLDDIPINQLFVPDENFLIHDYL